MIRRLLAPCLTLFLIFAARESWAQQVSFTQVSAQVRSTERAEVRAGLTTVKTKRISRAAPVIAKRISAGLPPPLLNLAIDTLAELPRNPSNKILLELISHRNTEVRVRAIKASAALSVNGASKALITALDDQEEEVRTAAVLGLVQLRARNALPVLFLAFEREVPEAAEAIGEIAGSADIGSIFEYFERMPFDRVTPILQTYLARTDIRDPLKIRVISRFESVNPTEAIVFLRRYLEELPEEERNPLREAVVATIEVLDEQINESEEDDDEDPDTEDTP